MIIDDLTFPHPESCRGTVWRVTSDQVMGGISQAQMSRESVGGRMALRLRASVSLENNGGFAGLGLDLCEDGSSLDVRAFAGIELEIFGNDEVYNVHLRDEGLSRPWQSFRHSFHAPARWTAVRLPFGAFAPNQIDRPLDLARLRSISLVALGRAFNADLAVAGLLFYADLP